MVTDFTHQTRELRALTESMIDIAIKGSQRSDSEPLIMIYGLILDCAYRIRQTMNQDDREN